MAEYGGIGNNIGVDFLSVASSLRCAGEWR